MKKAKILLPALVLVLVLTMVCGCAEKSTNGDKITFTSHMPTAAVRTSQLKPPRRTSEKHLKPRSLYPERSRNTDCL